MYRATLLFIFGLTSARYSPIRSCFSVNTIDQNINDMYCDQPIFLTMVPRSDDMEMIDNVCMTLFPLPDDPDTYQMYTSRVYCDGSNEIITTIATQISSGTIRRANSFSVVTQSVFGYAGCDTYLGYTCTEYGEATTPLIYGYSYTCRPIGLSCLKKVEEIIVDNNLPVLDYYILPMKLPNRCVTQQTCVLPQNPFYSKISKIFSLPNLSIL